MVQNSGIILEYNIHFQVDTMQNQSIFIEKGGVNSNFNDLQI